MLEPEWAPTYASKVDESHSSNKRNGTYPDLEGKAHEAEVEHKGNAVAEQRDKDHELPIGISNAKAHDGQIDL